MDYANGYFSMTGVELSGNIDEILNSLSYAELGERRVIVYPDKESFRKIYGLYTKKLLEQTNEMVILLPFYETVETVISVLQRQYGIDVPKHWKENSLLIVDGFKAYMGFQDDRKAFFHRVISQAIMSGKSGISVLMDMGVISFVDEIQRTALGYQHILPPKANLRIRGFFSYHKEDYDNLSVEQKATRFSNDYKSVVLSS